MISEKLLIALAVGLYLMGGLYLLTKNGSRLVAEAAHLFLTVSIIAIVALGFVTALDIAF